MRRLNRKIIIFVVFVVLFITFLAGYSNNVDEVNTSIEKSIHTVNISSPLILYFSDYENHGIGNTAYFFEDGTVIRRSTNHPAAENPCKVYEGKLPNESLDALKIWLKNISLESVDFGASPSSMFITLEDNKVKYIFEDAVFFNSRFSEKFLFHYLENEKVFNCEDCDLSSIRNKWNISGVINDGYKVVIGDKEDKEFSEIAQQLYGSFDPVYDEYSKQRFCSIPQNEEECKTGNFNIDYVETYIVLIDGNIYYLFANSQVPHDLLFSDRNLTLTDGTPISFEYVQNKAENAEHIYIFRLGWNPVTDSYEN